MLNRDQLNAARPEILALPATDQGPYRMADAEAAAVLADKLLRRHGLPRTPEAITAVCRQIFRIWNGCRDDCESEPGMGVDGPVPEHGDGSQRIGTLCRPRLLGLRGDARLVRKKREPEGG